MSIVTSLSATLAVFALSAAGASESSRKASELVTSYVNGTSPTLILGFDNNLDICLALRQPQSPASLRESGVTMTDSQRVLMQLWNLLERTDNGELRCTLPVIDGPVAERIEALAETVAEQLVESAGSDIETYVDGTRAAGWDEASYALLGSFVMDGLVWQALERVGAIDSADAGTVPSGSDYWSGVAWISLRPQAAKLGTNSHATVRGTLYSAWTPASLALQEALEPAGLRESLVALAAGASTIGDSERLDELGLVYDGELAVPVIRSGDALCAAGGQLAMKLGRGLLASGEFRQIIELTGARDRNAATIMAYHWVYPAMLSRLESGGLERPPVLDGVVDSALAPSLHVVLDDAACVDAAN